jgi:hypothetical protein
MDIMNLRGERGGIYISDTDTHTPAETGNTSWIAGYAITDCVISAITQTAFTNASTAMAGKTVPAGGVIWGGIQSIKLTSGTMQLFNYADVNRVGG